MLFTSEQQQNNQTKFEASAVNDLGPVKVTTGQKVLFWILMIFTLGIAYIFIGIVKVNRLNQMQNKINESASGIDIQLQKRFDTLTKLVSAVEGQVKFNKEVYENIAKFRSGINDNNLSNKQQVIDKIQTGLSMAFENYPQLGADESIRRLMTESTMIEKEIASARRLYNSDVTQFNTTIYNFPTSVVAAKKGYQGLNLFKADESVKKDVEIKF